MQEIKKPLPLGLTCYGDSMEIKYQIIENFYDNPNGVRQHALESVFVTEGNYPGKDTNAQNWTQVVIDKFTRLMNQDIIPLSGGNYRLSLAGDTGTRHIHFDAGIYVATLCLTPNQYCQGGTAFWKHNQLGIDYVDYEDIAGIQALGYESQEHLEQSLIVEDGQDESLWTQVDLAPFAFNRCVILKGEYLHSPWPQGWGNNKDNGRLTQHFFFELAE